MLCIIENINKSESNLISNRKKIKDFEPPKPDPSSNEWVIPATAIGGLAALGAGGYGLYKLGQYNSPHQHTTVVLRFPSDRPLDAANW